MREGFIAIFLASIAMGNGAPCRRQVIVFNDSISDMGLASQLSGGLVRLGTQIGAQTRDHDEKQETGTSSMNFRSRMLQVLGHVNLKMLLGRMCSSLTPLVHLECSGTGSILVSANLGM